MSLVSRSEVIEAHPMRMSNGSTAGYLVAALLMVAAFVQLNDPDPVIWFLFYAVSSVLVFGLNRDSAKLAVLRYLAGAVIAIAIAWALAIVYEDWSSIQALSQDEFLQGMSNEYPGNELLKELGGLLLCSLALLTFSRKAKTKPQARA